MSTALENLRDLVEEGIRNELFNAFRSRALFFEVAKHAEALNARGLGELFRFIQDTAVDALTLSLTKIFDKTNNHNRSRSIDEALRLLQKRTREFELVDRNSAVKKLSARDIHLDQAQKDHEIILSMCTYIKAKVGEVEPTLLALKDHRDKRIAHNESRVQIEQLELPTWEGVNQLIQVTIDFLDLVGYALLGNTCVISGRFVLARDAEEITAEFQDLIKRIGY